MNYKKFIKFEKFPTVWCEGCGIGIVFKETAKAFEELNLSRENTVVVSGIGCAGRAAGYFDLDSVHGLHGRALPLAEGIKRVNENLNVVVFSGDGDLLSIGGNHLLHSARRNVDITVICVNNEVYGMTGGQLSPTTKMGVKTITSPSGSEYNPLNIQKIITSNKNHFYARSTIFHTDHLRKCIKEAIKWKGFSFIDVIVDCIENYGKRIGFSNAYEMLMFCRDNYKINPMTKDLKDNELGIIKGKEDG